MEGPTDDKHFGKLLPAVGDLPKTFDTWSAKETIISAFVRKTGVMPCGSRPPINQHFAAVLSGLAGPRRVDWRDQGVISPPRAQGHCSICTAFACCALVEAMAQIVHGRVFDLSPADIYYCGGGRTAGLDGCRAGWHPDECLGTIRTRGVIQERAMPYGNVYDGDIWNCCPYPICTPLRWQTVGIPGFTQLDTVFAARRWLKDHGPLVTTFAVNEELTVYEEGVFHWTVLPELNEQHDVLVVGYDDDAAGGLGCWICKNSWGVNWGEDGFFRIRYDSLFSSPELRNEEGTVIAPQQLFPFYGISDVTLPNSFPFPPWPWWS